jgi:tetratricopeptide (TPR) repeat protein
MADQSPWDHVFGGAVDQGLALMRDCLASKRTPSTPTGLGIAYLWLERYATAWEHYQDAIETYPYTMDGFYKEAGVAKWCLNEPEIAIQQWQLGLRATYTEGAGGVSSALLLFAASILRPEVIARKTAEQFLTKKVQSKSPFAKNWPSHLGKFMLSLIDEEALREACVGVNELDTNSRNWIVPF